MLPLIHPEWLHSPHPTVRLAYAIARLSHAGQVDKGGQPYIDHPSRVAGIVTSFAVVDGHHDEIPALQTIALLHDVVEDTDVTLGDLRDHFDPSIVDAVAAISRRRNEPDDLYLGRILGDPLARRVKIADATDNSDESRLARLSGGEAHKMRTKYVGFLQRLSA